MLLFAAWLKRGAAALVIIACYSPLFTVASAQTGDTIRTPPVPVIRADSAGKSAITARPAGIIRAPASPVQVSQARREPPITPKRAFLLSLMVPGLGQSRLDRGTSGALFAAVELGSIAMIAKTGMDLKQARKYSVDSVAGDYTIGVDGRVTQGAVLPSQFPLELVSTRRLHREDWFAALLFNHLISGADAFVSAQLWDVPQSLALRPYNDGVALVATVRW